MRMQTNLQTVAWLLVGVWLTACGDDPSKLQCPTGETCGFTSIAAGYEHTCAIYGVVEGTTTDYGQVVCWGENRDGRCGAATGLGEARARQPMIVPDLNDAVSIAAGGTQTCAQRATGAMVCWGGNAFGELGDGEADGSFAPVNPKFPTSARDVKQIAAGGSSLGGTTCMRDAGQRVWCWGRNQEKQVRPTTAEAQDVPVQIDRVDAASDLAIGQDFVCAINGGQVQCWGDGFGSAASPVRIDAEAIDGTLLSAKGFMACVRGALDVKCFTNFDDIVSTPVAGALQVSAGALHTCALRSNNRVVCWGNPGNGRLGLGATPDASDPTNEANLADVVLMNATGDDLIIEQVASGASHSCALDSEHEIYCWGDNGQGQLGNGSETSQPTATLVRLQP
jgi:alpha-tubulin suppressor-like RCC1 family protein